MRTEKIRVRMLAGLLAAGLVLSLPAGGALALGEGTFTEETVNSGALAQDQNVQDAKEKKEALQKELDALNQQLANIQGDKKEAEETKAALEKQKNLITQQISALISTISDAEEAVAQKEEDIQRTQQAIEEKEAEIDEQWDAFKDQMAAMQMLNDTGYVAMLANVNSLYQLLTFSNTMQEISQQDTEILDNMKAQKEELNEQKAQLDKEKQELEAAKQELESQKSELDTKSGELAQNISATNQEISDAQAKEQAQQQVVDAKQKEYDQAEQEYENAVRAALSNAQGNDTSNDFTSSLFVWPLPGYHEITTYFGETQDINGYIKAGHKGIDVRTAGASPAIHAAAGGTVTVSTYSSSYGNYVLIYHGQDADGNGYATLYAHMSSRAVSEGETVSADQTIGYVGSTGLSTGMHLHFEVRVNGNPVNPFNYFS